VYKAIVRQRANGGLRVPPSNGCFMTTEKWNTPMVVAGGALIGAGAAAFKVSGNLFASLEVLTPHAFYILGVGAIFGIVCGIVSALLNRWE
jgi:hypothetical protein